MKRRGKMLANVVVCVQIYNIIIRYFSLSSESKLIECIVMPKLFFNDWMLFYHLGTLFLMLKYEIIVNLFLRP